MDLHNFIVDKFGKYKIRKICIDSPKEYIIEIYKNKKPLVRSVYTILGTYDEEKELWIWGDYSFHTDKSIINKTTSIRNGRDFRSNMDQKMFIEFIRKIGEKFGKNILVEKKSSFTFVYMIDEIIFINIQYPQ
jgi:hypothetical protein